MSWQQFTDSCQTDNNFAYMFLHKIIKKCDFQDVHFKAQGLLEIDDLSKKFEFIIGKTHIPNKSNKNSYSNQFKGSTEIVKRFPSTTTKTKPKQQQTILVVPNINTNKNFMHLMYFIKECNATEAKELWKVVADNILDLSNLKPKRKIYLNTDGTGVSWLHVRFDPTNAYYGGYSEHFS